MFTIYKKGKEESAVKVFCLWWNFRKDQTTCSVVYQFSFLLVFNRNIVNFMEIQTFTESYQKLIATRFTCTSKVLFCASHDFSSLF